MPDTSESKQPRPSQQAAEEVATRKPKDETPPGGGEIQPGDEIPGDYETPADETQEGAVPEGASNEVAYVDPYKQVLHPYELPANTVAAASVLGKVEVSDEVPISDERAAQAQGAIQAHQDAVQATVGAIGEDPRLTGVNPQGEGVEGPSGQAAEGPQGRATTGKSSKADSVPVEGTVQGTVEGTVTTKEDKK